MTLILISDRFAGKLSLLFLRLRSVGAGIRTNNFQWSYRLRDSRGWDNSSLKFSLIDYLVFNKYWQYCSQVLFLNILTRSNKNFFQTNYVLSCINYFFFKIDRILGLSLDVLKVRSVYSTQYLRGVSCIVCRDKLDNCARYGQATCQKFQQWAQDNCRAFCQFCVGKSLYLHEKNMIKKKPMGHIAHLRNSSNQ